MRPAIIVGAQREQLWRRYKAGETILGIGRALGQRPPTIHRVLQATGGIAPAQRSRSSRVLGFVEREEISRGIAAGYTFRAIARSVLCAMRHSVDVNPTGVSAPAIGRSADISRFRE
jgi:hypothetical protein